MSVLRSKRTESKAQYVNTADKIVDETMAFTSRLSNRYRSFGDKVIGLACDALHNAGAANSMFPADNVRKDEREWDLLRARGALMGLDNELARVYMILMKNPQGRYEKTNGELLSSDRAVEKLNKMSESLGCLIDEENALLTGVLKSDKQRLP